MPRIKAFTLKLPERCKNELTCYPGSIFEPVFRVNDAQQTGTTEIGRPRKTHNLQQHNQSSGSTLPSTIAHSRREPQRIVTLMLTGMALRPHAETSPTQHTCSLTLYLSLSDDPQPGWNRAGQIVDQISLADLVMLHSPNPSPPPSPNPPGRA